MATDPSGPGAMAPGTSADAGKPPINIDVVTTDWQWLFIYPNRHIALANKLVLPVHTPVRFRFTSSTVATDFFIPQLVGQIDVMPGMRTGQSLIADQTSTYEGFATEFNGPGFSWMRFQTKVVSDADYAAWAASMEKAPAHLDDAAFKQFATPTINCDNTTTRFSAVRDGLFDHVMQNVMMGNVYPTSIDGGPSPADVASPLYGYGETVVLFTSVLAYGMVMVQLRHARPRRAMMWLTASFLLGLAFIGMEVHELQGIAAAGGPPQRSGFLSIFWTIIVAHGIHLLVGLLWMAVMAI